MLDRCMLAAVALVALPCKPAAFSRNGELFTDFDAQRTFDVW
jgi:hypothetical protein